MSKAKVLQIDSEGAVAVNGAKVAEIDSRGAIHAVNPRNMDVYVAEAGDLSRMKLETGFNSISRNGATVGLTSGGMLVLYAARAAIVTVGVRKV